MSVKRPIWLLKGEQFFQECPIFVNRVHESFDMTEHAHEFVEITYVAEGQGAHYINGQTLPVQRGDLFFLPVGVSHVFRPSTPGKDFIVYNCLFPEAFLTGMLGSPPFEPQIANTFFGRDSAEWLQMRDRHEEVYQIFRQMYEEFASRNTGYFAQLVACLTRLLIYMHRARNPDSRMEGKSPDSRLIPALIHMEQHYAEPLDTSLLAARTGIGERQFQRLFKKRTGVSPGEYVQRLRIDKSCQMLTDTDWKIGDIAERAGYADMKHFYAQFKSRTGTTPRQYRLAHSK